MSCRIRRFDAADRAAMLAFALRLPPHDLLLSAIAEGSIESFVAEEDGVIVGTAAIVRDPLGWSRHGRADGLEA